MLPGFSGRPLIRLDARKLPLFRPISLAASRLARSIRHRHDDGETPSKSGSRVPGRPPESDFVTWLAPCKRYPKNPALGFEERHRGPPRARICIVSFRQRRGPSRRDFYAHDRLSSLLLVRPLHAGALAGLIKVPVLRSAFRRQASSCLGDAMTSRRLDWLRFAICRRLWWCAECR